MFDTLSDRLGGVFDKLKGRGALREQDVRDAMREVRIALSPAIVQQIFGPVRELSVLAFEPGLENLLAQALGPGSTAGLEPGVADFVLRSAADAAQGQEDSGVAACLLVPDRIRAPLARLLKKGVPRLRVLGHAEIPESQSIRIGRIIGENK